MNLIRKTTWAVVMLGAVAGCNGGDEANPPSSSPPTNLPAPKQPVVPPPTPKIDSDVPFNPNDAPKQPVVPPPTPKAGEPKDMQPATPKADASKKAEELPKVEGPKTEAAKGDTAAAKLSAEEIAAIKELPAAEQAQALKQAVCPVSGEHLGSMEKPVKTSAEGRTFYLCCENCQKEVKSDPKGVIAKLDAKPAQK